MLKRYPPGDGRLSFITAARDHGPFGRKAANLALGFQRIGEPFDVVYLHDQDGTSETIDRGLVREIFLGVRARIALPALYRYFRGVRPRMALAAPGQVGPPAVIAGKLADIPVLPWESTFVDLDMPEWPWHLKPLMRLQNVTYRRAVAVAAISDDIAAWITKHRNIDPRRVYKLPNPVDMAAVQHDGDSDPAAEYENAPFVITAAGRLTEQKGIDLLLEALGNRRSDLPEGWVLQLIGQGTWQDAMWEGRIDGLVGKYDLSANVKRLGWLENPHAVMKRSDVFVHAARWEPFGNVLCEALALGLPIIATDCPGAPREILDHGRYGVLVPNEDPAELGVAIIRLANEPKERAKLSARAPERARAYTPSATANRIMEIADAVA